MTLIELVSACALMSIVMLATFSFISFTTSNAETTLQNASVQNEMRLMMTHIENEAIPAIGGEITDDASIFAIGGPGDTDTRVLFGFNGNRFRIAIRTPGKMAETLYEYIEIPNLKVTFAMHSEIPDILIVNLSTGSDPNPRLHFSLQNEIMLPNLDTGYGTPITVSSAATINGGGNSLLIITPDPLQDY